MQGHRNPVGSFTETVDVNQGPMANNSGSSQQTPSGNMINPVESRLSNYSVSSDESACLNMFGHDVHAFTGWHFGEPSSAMNLQNQMNDDGMKTEHEWPSFNYSFAGPGPQSEERRSGRTNIQCSGRVDIGSSSNQVIRGPLFSQSPSSSYVPPNVNLNAEFVGSSNNNVYGVGPTLYRSSGLDSERMSCDSDVGTSSGSSSYAANDACSGPSLGNWGSSGKRKAFEGTSGQSYSIGSSSCLPQSENGVWPTPLAHDNSSSSLSLPTPSRSAPVGPPAHLNSRFGVGIRGVPSDAFPSSSLGGNAESSHRNLGRGMNIGYQQELRPSNASSSGSARFPSRSLPHQPPRPVPFSAPLDPRSSAGNSSGSQSQSHAMQISGWSRTMHPLAWNEASSSRVGSSSNSLISGERGTALQDEGTRRNIPRRNSENSMYGPANELRSLTQDATGWSLSTGSISTPGPSSGAQVGARSGIPLTPAWTSHPNPFMQNQQRMSEIWSLFPPLESESSSHGGPFPPPSSVPSASSSDTGVNSRNRYRHHRRSAFLLERQVDDIFGMPRSLRAGAVDSEGRQRLISEIRQVLNAMRRGENLRAEDYMFFDPFIIHSMAEVHDRHRDMRLDVDNMSYEELLELEERIGDVSTGLSEETILKRMKQRKYLLVPSEFREDMEPCCICQEEYVNEDDVGTLDCGHDFHTGCIKQWLMQKNMCPICKTTALTS